MSSREEIQITDLEPSIEGGEDIKYVVQIRGIDGTGRPGPWSEPLEFSSPQQIPSLESFNYVPGEQGWKLDNDGTFEVNDAFIRGELQSANYEEGVAGWRLKNTGDVEFSTGFFRGALQIGSNTFRVDSSGNLSIGGSSPSNAPFAVNTNGTITAMSISGSFIQANTITAAQIAANTITAGQVAANTITASQIASNTIRANEIRAGTITANEIADSTITGAKILGGTITGANIADATISGARIANSTITGGNIANATITDAKIVSLDADKITAGEIRSDVVFVGQLNGATGTFSGNLSAATTRARRIHNFSGQTIRFGTDSGTASTFIQSTNNLDLSASGRIQLVANGNLTLSALGSVILGSSTTVTAFSAAGSTLVRDSSGRIRVQSSSIKYKENIREAKKLENLLDIRPVYFDFKEQEGQDLDSRSKNLYGVIAEEVHELGIGELIYYGEDGPQSIHYHNIGLALIPYVKELYDKIEELEGKLDGN
jgi:hypothetical protein